MKKVLSYIILSILFMQVYGHGYISFPAARNHLWRFKPPTVCPPSQAPCAAPTTPNYDDDGLNNGGAAIQYNQCNGGGFLSGCPARLGFCGDGDSSPGAHLDGGVYSTGAIPARYEAGQKIFTKIFLTTNHCGYFQFFLVEVPDSQKYNIGGVNPNTYTSHLLTMANYNPNHNQCSFLHHDPKTQWCIPSSDCTPARYETDVMYSIELNLPLGVTCERCILRWKYTTGNSEDSQLVEIFQNCADIGIVPQGGSVFMNTEPSGWSRTFSGGFQSSNPPTPAPGVSTTNNNNNNNNNNNPTISSSSSSSSSTSSSSTTSKASSSTSTSTSTSASTSTSTSSTSVNPGTSTTSNNNNNNNNGFCTGKSGDYCSPTDSSAYVSCPNETNRPCQTGLICQQRPGAGVDCVRP